MKEHRSFINWIKSHKKELAAAGISIAVLIAAILCIRNKAALKAAWASMKKALAQPGTIAKVPVPQTPHKKIIHIAVEEAKPIIQLVTPAAEAAPIITRRPCLVPFEVDQHIRNLPMGRHASPEKVATALKHGFELLDGQTWVEAYLKGGAVA